MFAWDDPSIVIAPNAVLPTDPPPGPPVQPFTLLVSAKPAEVVDMKNFGTYYLDLPFVAAPDLVDV